MIPRAMDSPDVIEKVMLAEEIFEAEIPNNDAEYSGSPEEIVNWLELGLSNRRPNKQAARLLRKVAKDQQRPELAHSLDGPLRREQIAAIVREIFR